jgi:hypothetical protein
MDFSADLANIAVPTLLVWGDRDAFTGRIEQDDLSRAIKTSRLVVYEGAGHSPHWEEPQRFAGHVASFVAGLQGESAGLHTGAVSPLMIAVWNGQTDVVRTLLEEGADPNQPFGKPGLTAWQVAILANHQPSLELFAPYSGSRPKSHYTTSLFKAALQRGDRRLVAEFVRNGASFWFGDAEYSPLGVAAANGYVDVVRDLLDAGAPIDYQDRFGDTALMAAVRSGKVDAVRLLLDRGAKTSIADAEGMTALAWAERTRRQAVIDALAPASGARKSHHDHPLIPSHGPAVREAAARGLALLERNGAAWLEQQRCASCHHQGLLLPVARVARRPGFAVDETRAHAQEVRLRTFVANYEPAMHAAHEGSDEALARFSLGFFGQMTSGSALLIAALMSPESGPQALEVLATDAAARTQLADGRWRVGAPRIPIEESDFQTTALMIRALMIGAPRSVETAQRVARARLWLVSAPATTSVEKAYRLLGLHWSDADAATTRDAGQALLDAQEETGGWAQLPGLNADAFATGLALVALRETQGLTPSHTGYRRGIRFLIRTQQPDGSWFVHKRAASFNAYFESGFPYGKHQFSSFTGTAYATMALMYASQPEEKRHVTTILKKAPRT